MTLYPFAQTATETEVASKLFQGACSVGTYGAASRAQIDYLASLMVRNDASRAIYQDFVCNTSGALPVNKAVRLIKKLQAI